MSPRLTAEEKRKLFGIAASHRTDTIIVRD